MPKPTNQELADKIEQVDEKVDKRFNSMQAAFSNFRKEIREQLTPFHDYLVGQEAVEKAQGKNGKLPTVVTDLIKIIGWLVLAILAFLGVKAT